MLQFRSLARLPIFRRAIFRAVSASASRRRRSSVSCNRPKSPSRSFDGNATPRNRGRRSSARSRGSVETLVYWLAPFVGEPGVRSPQPPSPERRLDAAGGLRRMSQIAFFTRDGDMRGRWPRISRPHHAHKRADEGRSSGLRSLNAYGAQPNFRHSLLMNSTPPQRQSG